MTKRKLTKQQTARVRSNQRDSAGRAGQTPTANQRESDLGPEQTGLVIAHFGRQIEVEALEETATGLMPTGKIVRCHLRANLDALATGDRIVWRSDNATDRGVVVASLPRHSLLARPDSHSGLPRPVAANVDYLLIVIAPEPQPFANLIDRYLVAAESLDITPLLLLNKTDLITDANSAYLDALLHQYRSIGYGVLTASTAQREGLVELETAMRDRTCVFVGQSGVGKSSLISALLPGVDIRVGELSQGELKGRHTTTTARLFHLPSGGDLIDSPGIREFGLGHIERAAIETGFVEFRPWLGRCKFRDCSHEHEPDCALRAALANGQISPERMASFRSIVASLAQS